MEILKKIHRLGSLIFPLTTSVILMFRNGKIQNVIVFSRDPEGRRSMRSRCRCKLRRAMVRLPREMRSGPITGGLRVIGGAPSGQYIDMSRVIPVSISPL